MLRAVGGPEIVKLEPWKIKKKLTRRFLSLARGSNFLILSPRARRSIVKLEFQRGFNFLILRPRTRRSIVKLDSRTTRTQRYDGFPR